MTRTAPLVLLPGLGATPELLEPQRTCGADLHVPAWIANEPDESLAHYAERMAAKLPPQPPRWFLGGVSFGGMVALEMTRHVRPAPTAVFLIASARSGEAIATHLKYFVKFAEFLPERAFTAGQSLTPLFVQKFGTLTPEQKAWFAEILSEATPQHVRWGIAAITAWPGCAPPAGVAVHHIHGSDDELIPCANVQPDEVIQHGEHLINVTHAQRVNGFIAARLR